MEGSHAGGTQCGYVPRADRSRGHDIQFLARPTLPLAQSFSGLNGPKFPARGQHAMEADPLEGFHRFRGVGKFIEGTMEGACHGCIEFSEKKKDTSYGQSAFFIQRTEGQLVSPQGEGLDGLSGHDTPLLLAVAESPWSRSDHHTQDTRKYRPGLPDQSRARPKTSGPVIHAELHPRDAVPGRDFQAFQIEAAELQLASILYLARHIKSFGMFRKILTALLFLPFIAMAQPRYTEFVDPFIGTGGHGHTFPGATRPFGMVQLSPDTRLEGWDGCSGYHYSDSRIYGFSHTHLSGTGVADYCDILLKPMGRPVSFDKETYASGFSHEREKASPGFYSVFLDDDRLNAELTATTRVGVHRYTFAPDGPRHVLLDLIHRDPVLEASLEVIDERRVRGMRRSSSWARDQPLYFYMEFDQPILNWTIRSGGREMQRRKGIVEAKDIQAAFEFGSRDKPLLVKVAISHVSMQGAEGNMAAECPGWDFDKVRSDAELAWQQELSKIQVIDNDIQDLKNFYSALYHCMIHPNVASDADGHYRGQDGQVKQAIGYDHYTVFSLWDTYRALHPLLTIIDKRRTNDFIRSMLAMYEESGRLPVWELAGNETNCMIGYHAVSVIADAYAKKIRNWNEEKALAAMVNTAKANVFGLEAYAKKGYLEIEDESESVSKTLEYAYNDWCIAEMARLMRKQDIYEEFLARSVGYRHLLDPATGFIRPRSNGGWLSPFDPREVNNHFTEANAWQYTFYAPHDLSYLIQSMGGDAGFEKKLDELFESPSTITGRDQADITGLVGQYAQGNEPSHHMAYLYAFSGSPWKTQKWVDQIMRLYTPTPDGLPGNEDCGQMSAWYVMSAMGFYPVTPGSNQYIIGAPIFESVRIAFPDNAFFTIRSDKRSASTPYIQELLVNRERWDSPYLPQHFIAPGSDMEFKMGSTPNKAFGSAQRVRAKSTVIWPDFVKSPALEGPRAPFRGQAEVTITGEPGQRLYYTMREDGETTAYEGPFPITASTVIRAVAVDSMGKQSPVAKADFRMVPNDWKVEVRSKVHPQYTAGGPDALIDGMRGDAEWRKGRWQGYQGQELDLVIDLGKKRRITHIGASFLQDTRAWIVLPVDMTVYVSRNGVDFEEAGYIRHDRPAQTDDAFVLELSRESKVKKGRYVRIQARNFGKLPEWHPGAGGESYIFIDEVLIDAK